LQGYKRCSWRRFRWVPGDTGSIPGRAIWIGASGARANPARCQETRMDWGCSTPGRGTTAFPAISADSLFSLCRRIARNEWKWCGDSPLKGLGRPGTPRIFDRQTQTGKASRPLRIAARQLSTCRRATPPQSICGGAEYLATRFSQAVAPRRRYRQHFCVRDPKRAHAFPSCGDSNPSHCVVDLSPPQRSR
jgi:hypothetical protein